ncbi:hypothetical protein HDU98_006912 [Podochytrium sp. JEL0797]|nr:hypothetical protein HDU98_006912 [Podochytrium sp. JEL0797]
MPSSSSEKKTPHREMELDLEKPSTLKELRIEDVLIESVLSDRSTQQQIANIVTAFNTKAEGTGITFNDVIVQSWLRGKRVAAGDWFICHKNQVPFISASCQQKLAPHINFSLANTIARVNDRRYSVNDLIISVFGIHILNVPNMRYARGLIGTSNEPRLYGTGVHVIHDSTFSLADPPTVLSSEEYINHGSIHLVRVRPGFLAKIWIGVQAVLLPFKVDPYVFNDPLFRFDATISENEALISHGNQHIIRVPSGQVAKIWVNGQAVVLEARSDAYLFHTPYFSTAQKPWMVMATDSVIVHGSIKRLVPATGQVGVCYDAGKLAIVRPSDDGAPFIRDSPLFRFDDFLDINIATVVFPSERVKAERRRENAKANTDELNYEIVTTRDSLKLGVKLMMTYRIDNPELLLSVLSLKEIPNHIEQVCSTDLSRAIQQTTSQEFLSFNTSNVRPPGYDASREATGFTFMSKVKDELAKDLSEIGIFLMRLNIESPKVIDADTAKSMEQQSLMLARANAEVSVMESNFLVAAKRAKQDAEVQRIAQEQKNSIVVSAAEAELHAQESRAKTLVIMAEAEKRAAELKYQNPQLFQLEMTKLQVEAFKNAKLQLMVTPQDLQNGIGSLLALGRNPLDMIPVSTMRNQ